jgi:hypothetical protein
MFKVSHSARLHVQGFALCTTSCSRFRTLHDFTFNVSQYANLFVPSCCLFLRFFGPSPLDRLKTRQTHVFHGHGKASVSDPLTRDLRLCGFSLFFFLKKKERKLCKVTFTPLGVGYQLLNDHSWNGLFFFFKCSSSP